GEQQQSLRSDTLNPRHLWPSRAEILCTRLARLPRRRAPAKQLDAASTATIHSPTIALQSRQQLGSTMATRLRAPPAFQEDLVEPTESPDLSHAAQAAGRMQRYQHPSPPTNQWLPHHKQNPKPAAPLLWQSARRRGRRPDVSEQRPRNGEGPSIGLPHQRQDRKSTRLHSS